MLHSLLLQLDPEIFGFKLVFNRILKNDKLNSTLHFILPIYCCLSKIYTDLKVRTILQSPKRISGHHFYLILDLETSRYSFNRYDDQMHKAPKSLEQIVSGDESCPIVKFSFDISIHKEGGMTVEAQTCILMIQCDCFGLFFRHKI